MLSGMTCSFIQKRRHPWSRLAGNTLKGCFKINKIIKQVCRLNTSCVIYHVSVCKPQYSCTLSCFTSVVCPSVSLSGVLDPSLKAALESFSSKRRYEFWSDYVRDLVCVACDGEEEGLRSLSESQMLISAWRTLLILSTSHVSTYTHFTCLTMWMQLYCVYHNQSCVCVCSPRWCIWRMTVSGRSFSWTCWKVPKQR